MLGFLGGGKGGWLCFVALMCICVFGGNRKGDMVWRGARWNVLRDVYLVCVCFSLCTVTAHPNPLPSSSSENVFTDPILFTENITFHSPFEAYTLVPFASANDADGNTYICGTIATKIQATNREDGDDIPGNPHGGSQSVFLPLNKAPQGKEDIFLIKV